MHLAVYLLVFPLLWLVSRLPFGIIYFISDGLYLLLYYLVGYRKKVVRANLELAFPKKSKEERLEIEKKFYRHMCDIFLEMVKTLGMGVEEMKRRYSYTNLEVLHALERDQKNCIVMLPHYASWEWVLSLDASVSSKGYGIYQKLQNPYFDQLVRRIRSKFGTTLIATRESKKILEAASSKKETFIVGIISDQSPMLHRAKYWTKFMGILVPVHVGGEEISKANDLVPVYIKVVKKKRGYYESTFTVLAEKPTEVPDYRITDRFLEKVEESIREAPEHYFWTHKRWKRRNKIPDSLDRETGKVARP